MFEAATISAYNAAQRVARSMAAYQHEKPALMPAELKRVITITCLHIINAGGQAFITAKKSPAAPKFYHAAFKTYRQIAVLA